MHRRRNDARAAADLRSADGVRHVVPVQEHACIVGEGEAEFRAVQKPRKPGVIVPIHAGALRRERHGPIDRARVDDGESEPARELASDGALSRAGGSVDGHDRRHPGSVAQRTRGSNTAIVFYR